MIKKLFSNKIIIICMYLYILIICNNVFASNLSDENLFCNNAILMDLDSGNVLYGKNEDDKIFPASTTKILTAILALENLNLNDKITVSQNAVNMIPIESSVMGVKAGEIYTVEDLLYGLMLPSGNDAAIVLAESISGSVDKFVILMNNKLDELGLENTHFSNPHGYHDDNHYSTATDMANLLKYCLQNETFKKIISTLEYEIKPTNLTKQSRVLRSTSRICDPNYTNMYYEYILGGKTGYTLEANGTFVGYGSKDDKNIIVCVFNGSQDINGNQARFLDTKKLANYCFENFEKKELLDISNYTFKIYDKINMRYYLIGLNDKLEGLFKNDETIFINYDLNIDFDTLSILSYSEETSINNTLVGNLNILDKNGEIINSANLVYLGSQTYILPTSEYTIYILPVTVIILLILLLFISRKNK